MTSSSCDCCPSNMKSLLRVRKCRRPGLGRHGALGGGNTMAAAGDELRIRHPCLNTAAEPVSGGVLLGVACLDHRHRPSAGGAAGQKCTACRSTLLLRIRGGKPGRRGRMAARFQLNMNTGSGLTMRVSAVGARQALAAKLLKLMII